MSDRQTGINLDFVLDFSLIPDNIIGTVGKVCCFNSIVMYSRESGVRKIKRVQGDGMLTSLKENVPEFRLSGIFVYDGGSGCEIFGIL